ncbi:hypothetical protein cyc_02150 [Cyclospora cayetanensis]|uniref:Uncharacterized protein n=1 Tax=Cyclospora cayetanensis TaxID=88456 RepID=A0A1D3CTU2_9EIME|nr:hypothetical protein cyc_02150 [Cyclospora cayetanensis]
MLEEQAASVRSVDELQHLLHLWTALLNQEVQQHSLVSQRVQQQQQQEKQQQEKQQQEKQQQEKQQQEKQQQEKQQEQGVGGVVDPGRAPPPPPPGMPREFSQQDPQEAPQLQCAAFEHFSEEDLWEEESPDYLELVFRQLLLLLQQTLQVTSQQGLRLLHALLLSAVTEAEAEAALRPISADATAESFLAEEEPLLQEVTVAAARGVSAALAAAALLQRRQPLLRLNHHLARLQQDAATLSKKIVSCDLPLAEDADVG